jgi:hypothetical protein
MAKGERTGKNIRVPKLSMILKVDSLFSHVVIPFVILTLYFYLFSWLLPDGINKFFVIEAWQPSLLLTAGFCLLFFVVLIINKRNDLTFNISKDKLSASDLILVLFPLTPVIQYILNNQDILSPLGALYVLAVFGIFSAFFILVIPTLFIVIASTKTLMILGLAFTFTITNMASLSAEFHWLESGNLSIQLLCFSAVFLISWIVYNLLNKKLLYFLIIVYLITNIAIQLSMTPADRTMRTLSNIDNKLIELIDSRKPLLRPNIYLLIYDAYVINETMLQYGIDNSDQEIYLEKLGFKLYPHIYSLGALSVRSMSRVLNASTEFYGNIRKGVSGDGIIQNLLKSYGYKTYGIFNMDYFFWGIGSSYDYSFPEQSTSTGNFETANMLIKAIFTGEFRFDIERDQPFFEPDEQFMTYKLSLFKNKTTKPKFVYMHNPRPGHSQDSGACLPNETELFKERLMVANAEMKRDIETIIQKDPNGIIIVAGDHGPYLTKNCNYTGADYDITEITRLDIQDRFGCFLAIKWPTEDFSNYDDITVLQDIFPAVFAFLFKDKKLLKAKVEPTTLENYKISGASVKNGIIHGGINDGEPLFLKDKYKIGKE